MCPFTVRVPTRCCLADFLGSLLTRSIALPERARRTVGTRLARRICLPRQYLPPFNGLFRQAAAVSLLRLHIARAGSSGMFTASPIGPGVRLILRTRLTQGRLASPWNPWSFGEGESHPLYRYSYLHLPFRTLQRPSRRAFKAGGMLPYRPRTDPGPRGFGTRLHTRLLSTPSSSTSELLRTL